MSATTRTGSFSIGFRRGGSAWQKNLADVVTWAKANDFASLEVGSDIDQIKQVVAAGLSIGNAGLVAGRTLLSADKAERDDTVAKNIEFVRAAVKVGARNFFCVMVPPDPSVKRIDNFKNMVAGFAPLLQVMNDVGAKLVIEGWPGPGALCCTPETYLAFFDEVGSPAAGINYDPSHLIRMGIDPLRFCREFVDRIYHVHGKDTELLDEMRYELGHEQPATFAKGIPFGGTHWRYTIPGHGCMRWSAAFQILADARYKGHVSVELEDANFNGTEEGEKQGLIYSRQYLQSC